MTIVSLVHDQVEAFRKAAVDLKAESCAVGFTFPAGTNPDGRQRMVVRDFAPVPESAYLVRNAIQATLAPSFCLELANDARVRGAGLLLAHTHVGEAPLESFSHIDDHGEKALNDYFQRRVPGQRHFACLVTANGVRCRPLAETKLSEVRLVGRVLARSSGESRVSSERYDRQIRAFGADGQGTLQQTRVAIIGLGGTGSIVAQQLAHLGVREYLLIDPDHVAASNLNRLVGATAADIGSTKVSVAQRHVLAVNPEAAVESLVADVVDSATALRVVNADFMFLCTDSHASRAVVNQISYQYLIPCIDMGVAIHTKESAVTHVVGRVQMLSAGLPCLTCGAWLDAKQVRIEMMSAEQRERDPYFVGVGVEQPAVITLNSTIASLAVTMALSALTGFPADARLLLYDAVRGSLRPVIARQDTQCIVCSSTGALARGTRWPLPTRNGT